MYCNYLTHIQYTIYTHMGRVGMQLSTFLITLISKMLIP